MEKRFIHLGLLFLYMVLLFFGIVVEAPEGLRLMKLLGAGGLGALLCFTPMKETWRSPAFMLGFVVLALVESLSRYTVNDWFHLLYLVPLVMAYFELKPKAFAIISGGMLAAAGWKYLSLLVLNSKEAHFGQAALLMAMSAITAVILYQSLRIREERNDIEGLHNKLKETVEALETMTLHRERTRVSRELHDSLGHELTALIMKLELTRHLRDTDPSKSQSFLDEAIDEGREALRMVRNVVSAMQETQRTNEDLELLFDKTKKHSPLNIQAQLDWNLSDLSDEAAHAVYRAIQEALTNTLRHSKATRFTVTLEKTATERCVVISDDGGAAVVPTPGFGLTNMKARIVESGGTFSMSAESGLILVMTYPLT